MFSSVVQVALLNIKRNIALPKTKKVVVSEYIKHLQSYEEYAFSWKELLSNCNAPESTIEILNLRQGFYLIIAMIS